MRAQAWNVPTRGPSDVSGVRALLDSGELQAEELLCVLGKTEGNGGRNDFTRELAMSSLEHLLAPRLGLPAERVQERVLLSFSGGCEGAVSPHMVVLAQSGAPLTERRAHKRLALRIGHTRSFEPDEIGRRAQIEETAATLRGLVESLRLDSPADVHLVQLKGAIPPGRAPRNDMVHSRAASALGVALALGEIDGARLGDDSVCRDFELYSTVASCSAKPGLERTEMLVCAMSPWCEGDLVVEHGVLRDLLDLEGMLAVRRRLEALGAREVLGVFAKSEADPRGLLRGRRHVMLDDDDVSDTRWSRCVLGALLAASFGDTRVYVSTRAEHHGPLGGGPLALLGRV